MYINTNVSAMNSQRQLYSNGLNLDKSLERLSSGLRINTGADDASGLAIVEKMASQNVGLDTAVRNVQDGQAMFKVADGSMDQLGRIFARLEELAVRANNRTLTDSDRITIQSEIGQLVDQVDVISNNTEYNTLKLLDGTLDIKKSLTVGAATINGSIKILETPGTVQTTKNVSLSIITAAAPAISQAVANPFATPTIGLQNTININGVDIQIQSTDTVTSIISRINQSNSKTGVIAVTLAATNRINLVTGVIDADARNVVGSGFAAPNGSALGYTVVGTAATISLAGDNAIWSTIGFTLPLANYFASGVNVAANLGNIAMEGHGSLLEMKDSGSTLYGMKIGTNMYNSAYGGHIYTQTTGIASATNALSFANDNAFITTDDAKKISLQLGANYNQSIAYTLPATSADVIGVGASSKLASLKEISVITLTDANISLKVIQKAVSDITSKRAMLGAVINRLDYTDRTLRIQRENMASAESKLRDADMAFEMTAYTRNQILTQTSTAMLAQANSRPQNVMQLLK